MPIKLNWNIVKNASIPKKTTSVIGRPMKEDKIIRKVIPKLGIITASIIYIIASGFS